MRYPRSFLLLGSTLVLAGTIALARAGNAQPEDARASLEAAAAAVERLQTVRFSIVTTVQSGAGPQEVSNEAMGQCLAETGDLPGCLASLVAPPEGSLDGWPTERFTVSGEFQAPDRIHMTIEQEPFGSSPMEGIMIGEMWTRTGGGAWRLGAPGPGPVHPRVLGATLRELSTTLRNTVVTEQNGRLVIAGDTEIVGGAVYESPVASLLGGPVVGGFGSGPSVHSRVNLAVDRTTGYLEALDAETRIMVSPPEPPPGVPGIGFPIEQVVRTTLTLSNFNDPSIHVDRPG
jgi:hypothetical protein